MFLTIPALHRGQADPHSSGYRHIPGGRGTRPPGREGGAPGGHPSCASSGDSRAPPATSTEEGTQEARMGRAGPALVKLPYYVFNVERTEGLTCAPAAAAAPECEGHPTARRSIGSCCENRASSSRSRPTRISGSPSAPRARTPREPAARQRSRRKRRAAQMLGSERETPSCPGRTPPDCTPSTPRHAVCSHEPSCLREYV